MELGFGFAGVEIICKDFMCGGAGYARPPRTQLIVLRTAPAVLITVITLFIVLLCVM